MPRKNAEPASHAVNVDLVEAQGRYCLYPVSKDLDNDRSTIQRITEQNGKCDKRPCLWRDVSDKLGLTVRTHWEDPEDKPPCDSKLGKKLDGTIRIRELSSRLLLDPTPVVEEKILPREPHRKLEERGIHAGAFTWTSKDGAVVIEGQIQGLSNLGTVRVWTNTDDALMLALDEVLDLNVDREVARRIATYITQRCNAQGFMEGRMVGQVKPGTKGAFANARLVAQYRWYFGDYATNPPKGGVKHPPGRLSGLIEGVLIVPC
jgi:hypothetical protein